MHLHSNDGLCYHSTKTRYLSTITCDFQRRATCKNANISKHGGAKQTMTHFDRWEACICTVVMDCVVTDTVLKEGTQAL